MKKIILCGLMLGAVAAWASANNFLIEPIRVEIEAEPGEKVQGFYTITNAINQDINIAVLSKEYYSLDENKRFGLKWFKFGKKIYNIKKNESVQVPYTVKVPKRAKGFLMLLNSFGSQKLDQKGEIEPEMLHMVSSVPVYVLIKGRQNVQGEIEKIMIAGGTNSGVGVMVAVKNTGNVLLRPSGVVEIKNGGTLIGSVEIKEGLPVFPGASENYQGQQKDIGLQPGEYTVTASIKSSLPRYEMADTKHFTVSENGVIKAK